jgi:hypothetical protein
MKAGRMMIAGQRMADQDGIVALGVQLAIGLVDELVLGQDLAALQGQRLIEVQPLRAHQTDGIGWKSSRHDLGSITHRANGAHPSGRHQHALRS